MKCEEKVGKYLSARREKRAWQRVVAALSCGTIFLTFFALSCPAVALEAQTYCGLEEHTHSENCYTSRLVCTLEESSAHVHDDSCYENQQTLICGKEESDGHTHDETCTQRTLTCTEDHEHTDACYETANTCGLDQSEPHHHTDACYQTERVVTCTIPTEPHTHTDSCYENALTCPLEAHTHTLACYSDPQADVETEATWGKAASKVDLTGNWSGDLVSVAESQRAYEESTKNYHVETDEVTGEEIKKGYTRYGAWYNSKYNGDPYGDWSAMYLSFCLEYAGIPEEDFPREAATETWRRKLSGDWEGYQDCHFYTKAEDHTPAPGEIVFLDENNNQKSDRVVLITELTYDETEETPVLIGFKTIGGDVSLRSYPDAADAVDVEEFRLDDSRILGYATLPENPDKLEDPELAPEQPALTEEEAAQVNDIIARIDALPTLEELREALAAETQTEPANTEPENIPSSASAFSEAEGEPSVSQKVAQLYSEYCSMTEQQQEAVTNSDKLLSLAEELGLTEEEVFCGKTAHTHSETCYDEAGALTCASEAHTHTLACYSDPAADVESEEIWASSVSGAEITGFFRDDLLAVANTQLGYTESAKNYRVLDDGETIKGYTRYGHWYGAEGMDYAYNDWSAMFVSFCLNYAQIPEDIFPRSASPAQWMEQLQIKEGLYAQAGTESPEEGELVFFDRDGDSLADQVGIVAALTRGNATEEGSEATAETAAENTASEETVSEEAPAASPQLIGFTCIQGDVDGAVAIQDYALDDAAILGYGKLPKGETTLTAEGPDYTITVRYSGLAELPEDTRLVVSEILPGTDEYLTYAARAAEKMNEKEGEVTRRFFDLTLMSGDQVKEPAARVKVDVSFPDRPVTVEEETVVHFQEDSAEPEVLTATVDEEGLHYEQETFSVVGFTAWLNSTIDTSYTYALVANGCALTVNDGALAAAAVSGTPDDSLVQWQFEAVPNGTVYYVKTTVNGTTHYLCITGSEGSCTVGVTSSLDSATQFSAALDKAANPNTVKLSGTCADTLYYVTMNGDGVGVATDLDSATAFTLYNTPWGYNADGSIYWTDPKLVLTTEIQANKAYVIGGYNGNHVMAGSECSSHDQLFRTATAKPSDMTKQEEKTFYEQNQVWYFEKTDGDSSSYYIYIESTSGRQYLAFGGAGWRETNIEKSRQLELTNEQNSATVFTVEYQDETHMKISANVEGTTYYLNTAGGDGGGCYGYFWGWYKGNEDGSWLRIGSYERTHTAKPVETVSPSSTIINLFDYWTTGRFVDDTDNKLSDGINEGHTFQFDTRNKIDGKPTTYVNAGTGNATLTQGIVAKILGEDGYPVLSGTDVADNSTESLNYLFDTSIPSDGKYAYRDVQGLLQVDSQGYYYYDSLKNMVEFPIDYDTGESTNRNSFIVYDKPGVYPNSNSNPYGEFFPFNKAPQVAALNASNKNNDADNKILNHYFGMTVTTRFIQRYDGYTDSSRQTATTFHFSGDDDVWIFIDDVLVADLGGKHTRVGVTIDFTNGSVTYDNGVAATTIKDAFIAAYGENDSRVTTTSKWNGNTFANNTTHTLKFYYLERGNFDSNLDLKFNLTEIPPTSIYKVDQYGNKLAGAVFAVYKATKENGTYEYILDAKDSDGNTQTSVWQTGWYAHPESGKVYASETAYKNDDAPIITPAYCDVTDDRGDMVFVDEDDAPYTMAELYNMFGDHFILREVHIPAGYRTVTDEVYLYTDGSIIFCEDPYKTGVWASPNAMVTATNTLYPVKWDQGWTDLVNEQKDTWSNGVSWYDPSQSDGSGATGTLFAVVLKRNDRGVNEIGSWYPVYGNDEQGYTVMDTSGIDSVIQAAKTAQSYGNTIFKYSASGMQVTLENLPGDPTRYFSYLWERRDQTTYPDLTSFKNQYEDDNTLQYFVAYYYTEASSLEGANANNTFRVISHTGVEDNVPGFSMQWGTTIEVPNMENRLFVQKRDKALSTSVDTGLIDNAVFALYPAVSAARAGDMTSNLCYYLGEERESKSVAYIIPYTPGMEKYGQAAVFAHVNGTLTHIGDGDYYFNTEGITVSEKDGSISGGDGEIGLMTVEIKNGDTTTCYDVHPAKNAGGAPLVGATHDTCSASSEKGTGHFDKLKTGEYLLREILAPSGYALNDTDIPVLVNEYGVYANAGMETDGVSVGNGIGYLTKTLDVFASPGHIDETLTWVYGALIRSNATGFTAFDNVTHDVVHVQHDGGDATGWEYAVHKADDLAAYGRGTVTEDELSEGDNLRSHAMVIYYEYNGSLTDKGKNPIFDYVPNDDTNGQAAREAAGTSGVATQAGQTMTLADGSTALINRLWTKTGWSDMAIYQDYAYGRTKTSSNTKYTDLTSYGNISNLFSSSTFVQVTDETIAEISKEVKEDSNGKWGSTNDASIGDRVKFKEIVKVHKGAQNYDYVVHDVMSEGLTLDLNSIKITAGNALLIAESDYKIVTDNPDGSTLADGCTFEIKFTQNFLENIKADTDIFITYYAMLNENAVIGLPGNPNKTWLDYMIPFAGVNERESSKSSETITYTWDMDVLKFTKVTGGGMETEKPLADAEFVLLNSDKSKAATIDGGKVTGWADIPKAGQDETITWPQKSVQTTDEDGKIAIAGLDSDTYYLREVKAPDGYNLLTEDVEVTIISTTTSELTYSPNVQCVLLNSEKNKAAAIANGKITGWVDEFVVDENGDFIVDENGNKTRTKGTVLTTGKDGKIVIDGLNSGTYYLRGISSSDPDPDKKVIVAATSELTYSANAKYVLLNEDKTKVATISDGKVTGWVDVPAVDENETINWPKGTVQETDKDGKTLIDGVELGTYYLRKISDTPSDDSDDVQVVFTGAVLKQGKTDPTYTKIAVKVENKSSYVLPATGGSGSAMYTVAGWLLLAGAGLLWYVKHRKRKGTAA